MRLGVIRGDLPGPIFLSDLEPVSRYNPAIDPRGQERYVSRPSVTAIEAALADATTGAGAVLNGGDISGAFPLVINVGNQDLKVRTAAAPTAFTTVAIANAAYATLATLVAAVNAALAGTGVTARTNVAGNGIALESNTKGVSSYLENDNVVGGSTANTPLSLTDGSVRTMPAATAFITACLPVGGPLDVSTATVNGVGAGTSANALSLIPASRGTVTAVADAIAPQFIETPVAMDSFLVGNMADLLSANFNPDTRRQPAIVNGPAIEVVEDDGSTPFALTLPVVAAATLNLPVAGAVSIVGTGLGHAERNETFIKFTGVVRRTISQPILEAAGGSVSDTLIIIPASLIPGATTVTTSVQVQVRQRVSHVVAVS
jgi:hypothetical protein